MKKQQRSLKLRAEQIRMLTDLAPVNGAFVTVSRVSGDGCPTSCWCISDFVSDCGPC